MLDVLTLSEEATVARFDHAQDRVVRDFGYGDTEGALGIARANLKRLSEAITEDINQTKSSAGESSHKQFCRLLENLDPDVVALCALSTCLGCVASEADRRSVMLTLGRSIAAECWAHGLLESNRSLALKINRAVKERHGNLKYRKQAARSIAARAGYKQKHWSSQDHLKAGSVMLEWVTKTLPDVFVMVAEGSDEYLTITEGALAVAEASVEHAIQRNPVLLPCTTPPKPWTAWDDGGYWDEGSRLRAPAVRVFQKEGIAAIKAAFRNGTAQPHFNGLNNLQAVAWRINKPIYEIVCACADEGLTISGIPSREPLPEPPKPRPWEYMTDDEKKLWKAQASSIEKHNRTERGNLVLFAQDMKTAEMLLDVERFYTPVNCDWRGRAYGIPHFNFQRDDRVRALFLFADGLPLGEDGMYALKVQIANCGDFEKVSKKPLDARVAWVDANLEKILECTNHPLSASAKSFWMEADKPFLFLAACMELAGALTSPNPMNFMTHLPIASDGTCSGLQHLCAMTRAPEGSLVNLTPSPFPQDVYQKVADAVNLEICRNANGINLTPQTVAKDGKKRGLTEAEQIELAELCLKFGITRKVVKRNVMTYGYSSKRYGMAKQQDEDLIDPLTFDVLSRKLTEHPFGRYADKPHPNATTLAAQYLADKVYTAIQEIVNLPEQAMVFLRKIAKALAHEGKPATWTTPTGLPWANRYYYPKVKRVELWLHDARVQISLADGTTKVIDKDRAANGIAPNFVHALDAAHLMLTVNAAVKEGITQLATVHDSFGCLAPQVKRLNQIIREQFVAMYEEHDVLKEVLEEAKCALMLHNRERLPKEEELRYGTLDIRQVLDARYAFS